jgi:cell division protein FtsZ
MTINLKLPDAMDLKPRITVFGVGGAGGNAVNNMIESNLMGVEFVVANTDAQALSQSACDRRIQMGTALTEGLGAGSQPEVGGAAAEEALPEIIDHLAGAHMVFITAGMGGGTGTGAAPVIARAAREQGILTVGVVTKPFQFEGQRRMATAERGIAQLAQHVDTLIVIPNQNLFRVANEKTTFADAFAMADQVLYSGVAGITDLMVKEGLINLDFADVRAIMSEMGKAMMGTGEASGEKRALEAAEAAIANPLLDDVSMKGAKGLLISITGGNDLTLYEVDEAATRIREEVDKEANIILGATFDESLDGVIRVSVVATGIAADTFVTMPEEERAGRLAAIGGRRPYVINDRPSFAAARRPAETVGAGVAAAEEERYDEPELIDIPEPEMAPAAVHPAPVEERYEAAPVVRRDPPAPPRREAPPTAFYDTLPDRPVAPQQRPDDHAMRRDEIAGASRRMPPRMPDVDDFPPIAVREMQARSGHGDEIGLHAQKKRVGFLERLANVGIGFKDPVVTSSKHREPSVSTQFGAEGPNQRTEAHRRAEHAAQQAAAGAAHHPDFDEDQLEIPAFLRRQAN